MLQTITYVLVDVMLVATIAWMLSFAFSNVSDELRYRRLKRRTKEKCEKINAWKRDHPGEPIPADILK